MKKYSILYTKTAVSDINKLDTVARKRIGKKIKIYLKTPLKYSKKLIHPSIGNYRWRIGNYRVIFDIKKDKIIVLRVGHRKNIYR